MVYNNNNDKNGINLLIKRDELKEKLSINDNDQVEVVLFLRIYKKNNNCN